VAVVGYTTQSLFLYPFPTRFAIASVSMCHVPLFDTSEIETNQTNRNNLTFIRTQAKPTTTRSKVTRTWRCPNRPCRRHQAPGHRSVIESLNLSPVHDPPVVVPQLEGALEDQTQQDHGSITRSRHVSRADRHVPHVSDPPFNLIGLHILRPVRGRICRRRRNVDPR